MDLENSRILTRHIETCLKPKNDGNDLVENDIDVACVVMKVIIEPPVERRTMKPLVIEYLRNHSFQQLEDEHGVCVRFSNDGSKASLNYDQILVKNGDPVAEQCRGMVIRPTQFDIKVFGDAWKQAPVGNVDVLAWPMNRFYNHGDANGAQLDWDDSRLRIYEKLDGTMMVVYWDPLHSRWHAGTRSVPEADLPIRKDHMEIGDMTFSELFFKALRATR